MTGLDSVGWNQKYQYCQKYCQKLFVRMARNKPSASFARVFYCSSFQPFEVQLFSRSVALIGPAGGQQDVFALMDFGEKSVPIEGPITGLVMGMGAYATN